ncbi:MAG: rod shape-determining protein MreD [Rhodothermales bacterium]|jgi:rod shape-determining protein MreD
MPVFLRNILIGIAAILVQWLIASRLRLWGAYADIVLLFLTLQALRYGRLVGSVSGFALGLALDVIYGTWGIQMFVKTVVGFLIGLFPTGERGSIFFTPLQAFVGALVIALLHNGLMVVFQALVSGTRNTFMITSLWIGSAVYTAVIAGIASLFYSGRS